ncbi:hypothetical protein [Fusibacter bizertensis]
MTVDDYIKIIKEFPQLLQYFVPGYLFLKSYTFFLANEWKTNSITIFESVAISYIFVLISDVLLKITGADDIVGFVFQVISAIIASFVITKFIESDLVLSITSFFGIKRSLRKSIWDDFVDQKNGNYVKVYLSSENTVYQGKLISYDFDKENSTQIAINRYKKFNLKDKLIDEAKDERWVILIKLDEVSRVEFYYAENSYVVKKYNNE